MSKWTADFETVTWKEETDVWAWAISDIYSDKWKYGTDIEEFMKTILSQGGEYYFHNLKFDGEFIIYYLLTHNYRYITDKKDKKNKTFTTLISDMGQFYNMDIYDYNKHIKIIDSLKIIPFSVEETAKAFNLPISKLEIDYNKVREKGHILTEQEVCYIENDVKIMSKALRIIFDEGLTKGTRAANALCDYKNIISKNKFEHYFPKLDKILDNDIRQSYKGGFTYLNPIYTEKEVEEGVVLDVNSLYPWVMKEKELPFGEPFYFKGKYVYDEVYPLYIQMIVCSFKLKENKIPTIQIKNNGMFFNGNEYLENSKGEIVCLVLTCIDLKLFLEHYNVDDLEYVAGWKFKCKKGLFDLYINKWIERKNQGTINKNAGERTLAKLMLNSLYGKFATSLETRSKIPYLGEDEIVHYKLTEIEEKEGIYIPIASFITAYAREKTIRTSQAIKDYSIRKYGIDKYIYSDTDSIHTLCNIEELKQFCEIDEVELGKWKHEGTFKKAKFIRQKCYIEQFEDDIKITCAGMPKRCHSQVKWNEFKTGFSCGGKLTFKHVKGGVKLVETDFTIKEKKIIKSLKGIEENGIYK